MKKLLLILLCFPFIGFSASSDGGTMWVFKNISQYETNGMKLLMETEINSCFLLHSNEKLIQIKMGKESALIDYIYSEITQLDDGDFKIILSNGDFLIITDEFEENINIFWYKDDIIIRLHKATQDISEIECFE